MHNVHRVQASVDFTGSRALAKGPVLQCPVKTEHSFAEGFVFISLGFRVVMAL